MGSQGKKVLYINLDKQESEVKSSPDLEKYIGGVGLAIRLLELHKDLNPIIFAIGPLNGLFPFVSKTAITLIHNHKVEDIYLGGSLSTRIKFSDLDAIVIFGQSKEKVFIDIENDKVLLKGEDEDIQNIGLPGKRSILSFSEDKLKLDDYFESPQDILEEAFKEKKVVGMCVTGTKTIEPPNIEKYTDLYILFLDKTNEITVDKGFFPSCSGCPMGCEKSKVGESGGNILVHSLVACSFAQNVYNDVSAIFSALNTLGYKYTHEDIENLQEIVQESLNNI